MWRGAQCRHRVVPYTHSRRLFAVRADVGTKNSIGRSVNRVSPLPPSSLSVCLPLTLSHTVCPSPSHCLSICFSLCLSVSLSLPVCLSPSVCLSLSHYFSVCLSPSVSVSVAPYFCLSVCLTVYVSLSLSLSVSVTLSLSVCLSAPLSLFTRKQWKSIYAIQCALRVSGNMAIGQAINNCP